MVRSRGRFEIALWTAETGDTARAIELWQALITDATRVLGPAHDLIRDSEANLTELRGQPGDATPPA
ncbi:hypothetical protein I6A60_15655 [Frankia sp. AgB1.9]|uniref:hypothetical protein n=1 Tax=unclassified Frankia TaxID=2632575 RepID=UPI0019314237|nr:MULTISPECIES: hypothetical protein [unclassified Frankia]MBL7492604.1 hypothetical protein [Frankia sp. AgW1.1]MBL7549307.1 hypothetical protein [Frankia sp. AgB1.9]MBL7619226.1 hypothetical protein [Frankia sp. AgB1.8]